MESTSSAKPIVSASAVAAVSALAKSTSNATAVTVTLDSQLTAWTDLQQQKITELRAAESLGPLAEVNVDEYEGWWENVMWSDSCDVGEGQRGRGVHWSLAYGIDSLTYIYCSDAEYLFDEYEAEQRQVPGELLPENWYLT